MLHETFGHDIINNFNSKGKKYCSIKKFAAREIWGGVWVEERKLLEHCDTFKGYKRGFKSDVSCLRAWFHYCDSAITLMRSASEHLFANQQRKLHTCSFPLKAGSDC